MDEKLLIRRLKLGDESAFRTAFDEYHVLLLAVARTYLHDTELSEDAVQEVFIKLWKYRGKLDPEKSLEGFLFTLIKNQVLSMIRANKRETNKKITFAFRQAEPIKNSTEERILYSEYEMIFSRALEGLSSGKREVYELRSQGYSNAEVAALLNITVNTVKSQYYEACLYLRRYLDRHADIQSIRSG